MLHDEICVRMYSACGCVQKCVCLEYVVYLIVCECMYVCMLVCIDCMLVCIDCMHVYACVPACICIHAATEHAA